MRNTVTIKRQVYQLSLKLLFICSYLFLSSNNIFSRIQAIDSVVGILVFILLWIIIAGSLILFSLTKNNIIKVLISACIVLIGIIGKSYFMITSQYLTYSDFEGLIKVIGFVGEVIEQYPDEVLTSSLIGLTGLTGLLLPPSVSRKYITTQYAIASMVCAIMMVSGVLYKRGGEGSNGLLDYNNLLSFSAIFLISSAFAEPAPDRKKVTISVKESTGLQNIIFIMDESIRGDYLDINNPQGIQTRFPENKHINFGIASSAANCSASTNVTIRYGARRSSYLKDIKVNPSFWAYARKAGYSTYYIDAQRTGGYLMNLMGKRERSEIDNFVQIDSDVIPYDRDILVAAKLKKLIQKEGKKFIFINKMGVHFPYEGKYPVNNKLYVPTMKHTYFGNKIDPDANEAKKPDLKISDVRNRAINSYKNALSWNVTQFFNVLLDKTDLGKTVIIYTSDHGQDFHEDGRPGWITHCRVVNASREEGMVPMVFISENKKLLAKLRKAASYNFNKVSHFNIFSTLLQFLGYHTDRKKDEYSVFDKLPDMNRQFISYFYTRFGKKTVWVSLDH